MLEISRANVDVRLAQCDPLSAYFASLARQLIDWQRSDHNRVAIGVAGCERGVGTTTCAVNLSMAMATIIDRPVLLVQSDFGMQSLVRRGRRNLPGLSDVLSREEDPHSTIAGTNLDNLFMMGCGTMTASDSLLLPFNYLPQVIEELRLDFSSIVFELPPAADSTAFYGLIPAMDGITLVCDPNRIEHDRIRRTVKRATPEKVIGLIVNKTPKQFL